MQLATCHTDTEFNITATVRILAEAKRSSLTAAMSKVIYLVLTVSLSLLTTAAPVRERLDQLNNKTKEFYCTSVSLKTIISQLIRVG